MNNLILRAGTFFLTFTFGLAGNFLINGLGSLVERWMETPEPVLEATDLSVQPLQSPFVSNCDPLVVVVGNDRSLWLNREWMGNLDNPSGLVAKLNEVFTRRAEARAYRPGFELNLAVPEWQRIERTVFIKAPRGLSYGEVSDLIDEVKTTGAEPIGLVTNRLSTNEQGQ
jgi:biopolymer transport protein ExbD